MNIFDEIHQELPREGPGDEGSTQRALSLLSELPSHARILDIGCGPGIQTGVLAKMARGYVAGLDIRQRFLERLRHTADAAGISSQIAAVRGSMSNVPFKDQSFDAIWSEGAIYIMGFEQGLREWRRLLKPAGYIAVSELTWLQPSPPIEASGFWRVNHPAMRQVGENLEIIRTSGYRETGHFVLPASSWWDDYYGPLEQRIGHLRLKYRSTSDVIDQLDAAALEVELFRKYSDSYGYVFYTMRAC